MTGVQTCALPISIQVWDGDRELSWTEVNTADLAQQLRDFADIIEEAE